MWTEAVSTRICACRRRGRRRQVQGRLLAQHLGAPCWVWATSSALKYAMIITAGSCLVWFLVVPLVGSLADSIDPAAMASLLGVTRADIMADPQRFHGREPLRLHRQAAGHRRYRHGRASSASCKQSKIIRQAVRAGRFGVGGGNKTQAEQTTERTQRDLTMKRILTILIATLVCDASSSSTSDVLDGWVQMLVTAHSDRLRHLVPLHDRGGQRHRHRRHEPRVGHDADDAHPLVAGARKRSD